MSQQLSRRSVLTSLAGTGLLAAGAGTLAVPTIQKPLFDHISAWNDRAQSALFAPNRLAQTYPANAITSPFRYNGFYPEAYAPRIDPERWQLAISGRITQPATLNLADLRAMPQESQITRLICIEGWSAVGQWSGVPLAHVLRLVGADLSARYVAFRCADEYSSSIDMASALHPQTILALDFLDRPLPPAFGAPMRLRIPTKLGFKNAKFIHSLEVTNNYPGGYWEDQGYNWFAGL